ncbi:MAG: RlmE family RNA methyltransferase [Deltaproteobacteria bacterium]|nr:RlmE family RNA methyltransferase [Deltaproteobacteria bacterium]
MTKKKKKRWADHYTVKAKKENYPARSIYKLQEIQKKYNIIKRGGRVLDLGFAPGSWLLYAAHSTGEDGSVIGIDIKDTDIVLPNNAKVIKADIFEYQDNELFADNRFDVVLSDMAPDTTGNSFVDSARSLNLAEAAFLIAKKTLAPKGSFVCKIFFGEDFKAFTDKVKGYFKEFKIFKPKTCRKQSKEIYIVGKDRSI